MSSPGTFSRAQAWSSTDTRHSAGTRRVRLGLGGVPFDADFRFFARD
jgi:hypothetical protein